MKDFANERKLAWQQDGVGNMVIKRTGSGGGEMAPAVVIQVLVFSLPKHASVSISTSVLGDTHSMSLFDKHH